MLKSIGAWYYALVYMQAVDRTLSLWSQTSEASKVETLGAVLRSTPS